MATRTQLSARRAEYFTAGACLCAALVLLAPAPALAQWPSDPSTFAHPFPGIVVEGVACAADGAGGLLVMGRAPSGTTLHAQHLGFLASLLWGPAGKSMDTMRQGSDGIASVAPVSAVPDDSGGIYAIWQTSLDSLLIQRFAGTGLRPWSAVTRSVADSTVRIEEATSAPDGRGGLIIAWADRRYLGYDFFVQRIGADGSRVWSEVGLNCSRGLVSDTVAFTYYPNSFRPCVQDDGAAGAWVAWSTVGSASGWLRGFLQHFDSTGTRSGPEGGLLLFSSQIEALDLAMTSDGAGGVIVVADAWDGSPTGFVIRAQRVDHNGNRLWGPDGVLVPQGPLGHPGLNRSSLTSDGNGGAFVLFGDHGPALQAQHVAPSGNVVWAQPVSVSSSVNWSRVLPDGAGGFIASWELLNQHTEVHLQRFDANGTPQWAPPSVTLTPGPFSYYYDLKVAPDGSGGAFFAGVEPGGVCDSRWIDHNGTPYTLGVGDDPPHAFIARPAFPNPAAHGVTVRFDAPAHGRCIAEVRDIAGRLVQTLLDADLPAGAQQIRWDGRDRAGRRVPNGIYLVRIVTGDVASVSRVSLIGE